MNAMADDAQDRAARAAERRRSWQSGVAKDFAEMAERDLAWWASIVPEERLGMVFELWNEQASLSQDPHEDSGRLQRAIGGVRQRGR